MFTLWHTPVSPSREIVEAARAAEASGEALYVSLLHGFPWSDGPDAGAAVMVTTDADPRDAEALARRFADALWQIREADLAHYCTLDSLPAQLESSGEGPLVIADAADNPGAGCGGDSTWLLHALRDAGIAGVAVAMLIDPAAVGAARRAGVGATVTLALGGYAGALSGAPFCGDFEVVTICEDAAIDGMPGSPPHRGMCLVRLRLGGMDLVVSDYREQVFGPRVFREVGIDPTQQQVLVVKSAQHFYNAFAVFAGRVLYVDSPCTRSIDFQALPFASRRRPMWPLEMPEVDARPRLFERNGP